MIVIVICVLLDASKAFDRIEYVKLFSDLRERILCPIYYGYS